MGTDVHRLNPNTNEYELNDYIKSDEEINKETEAKIREKYSAEDELKLNRLANSLPKSQEPPEFRVYHEYIEQCRAEGAAKKQAAAEARAALIAVELTDEITGNVRIIYTRE